MSGLRRLPVRRASLTRLLVLGGIAVAIHGLLPAPAAAWLGPVDGVVENRGQFPGPSRFVASQDGATLSFTPGGVVVDLPDDRHSVWMTFDGASPSARIEPLREQSTRLHFFLGADPGLWTSDVPVYRGLVYGELWPGIDLEFRLEASGLRYEIRAARSADASTARWSFDGARCRPDPEREGSVLIETPARVLRDERSGDGRQGVLRWAGTGDAREETGEGDGLDNPSTIAWSTFLGGGGMDRAHGFTLDPAGNPTICGYSNSYDFPATPGAYDVTNGAGSYDAVIAKFDSTGSNLLWATYLGGDLEDRSFGIMLDRSENAVIGGLAYSTNFPTTPGAYDRTLGGERDCFIAKVSADGSRLLFSTYLGGSGLDRTWDLILDPMDRPVIVGETYSSDFPVTPNAVDTTFGGVTDGFVAKISAGGSSLLVGSYIGGSNIDQITYLARGGPQDRLYMVGNSSSVNFPTTPGAFDPTHNGAQDCVVVCMAATGDSLHYGTFLGGSQTEMGNSIDADPSGEVVAAASSQSANYPITAGAFDTTHNGNKDVVLTRLTADGSAIVWSTYIGGNDTDDPFALILDDQGRPTVAGETLSPNYPTTPDGYDRTYASDTDILVSQLSATGSRLEWSSYIGGTLSDEGWELGIDAAGNPYLVGPTRSPEFPTTAGAYDRTHNGNNDIFVLHFDFRTLLAVEDEASVLLPPCPEPNPFSQAVTLRFDLPRPSDVRILAFDASGRRVANVYRGHHEAGTHRVAWDGRDDLGRPVPAGAYWLRIVTNGAMAQQKAIRLR